MGSNLGFLPANESNLAAAAALRLCEAAGADAGGLSIDLEKTAEDLKEIIETGKGQRRAKAIKRLKVVDAFLNSDRKPHDMILDVRTNADASCLR